MSFSFLLYVHPFIIMCVELALQCYFDSSPFMWKRKREVKRMFLFSYSQNFLCWYLCSYFLLLQEFEMLLNFFTYFFLLRTCFVFVLLDLELKFISFVKVVDRYNSFYNFIFCNVYGVVIHGISRGILWYFVHFGLLRFT